MMGSFAAHHPQKNGTYNVICFLFSLCERKKKTLGLTQLRDCASGRCTLACGGMVLDEQFDCQFLRS
jgi:hypothetical protein